MGRAFVDYVSALAGATKKIIDVGPRQGVMSFRSCSLHHRNRDVNIYQKCSREMGTVFTSCPRSSSPLKYTLPEVSETET